MKTFALLALLTTLTACGTSAETSETSHYKPAKAKSYSFTVDARPVDGNYQNITVKQNESGSYDADLHVITAGFGFPVEDTVTNLAQNLECVANKHGRNLLALKCEIDLRPADGELIVLKVKRNSEGRYDATLRNARYATLQAPETDVTTEIAYGLELDR